MPRGLPRVTRGGESRQCAAHYSDESTWRLRAVGWSPRWAALQIRAITAPERPSGRPPTTHEPLRRAGATSRERAQDEVTVLPLAAAKISGTIEPEPPSLHSHRRAFVQMAVAQNEVDRATPQTRHRKSFHQVQTSFDIIRRIVPASHHLMRGTAVDNPPDAATHHRGISANTPQPRYSRV